LEVLGKRLFRTRDGRLIELPDDMTYEQAARLEAEATAAEKQIGKGPPPQPVPDVKKLVKKEEKKDKPKKGAKGSKEGKAGGKGAGKGAALPAPPKAPSTSKVAQYLTAKAAPKLFDNLRSRSLFQQTLPPPARRDVSFAPVACQTSQQFGLIKKENCLRAFWNWTPNWMRSTTGNTINHGCQRLLPGGRRTNVQLSQSE
jgi:hypothetical protein